MFAAAALSDQQVLTLYLAGTFLVVASLVLAPAALAGYVHRASRPAG